MIKIDFKDYKFSLVTVKGKEFLFSDLRINSHFRHVPADIKTYSIRHGDDDSMACTIEPAVLVNHFGDLIVGKDTFEFPENDPYISIDDEEDGLNFATDDGDELQLTYEEFLIRHNITR